MIKHFSNKTKNTIMKKKHFEQANVYRSYEKDPYDILKQMTQNKPTTPPPPLLVLLLLLPTTYYYLLHIAYYYHYFYYYYYYYYYHHNECNVASKSCAFAQGHPN